MFATNVQYGSGSRFDPMTEEKGVGYRGEAQWHDIEMTDAMIEVIDEANNQISRGELNPFKAQLSEVPPSNHERNSSRFLVRKNDITFEVQSQTLFACIAYWKIVRLEKGLLKQATHTQRHMNNAWSEMVSSTPCLPFIPHGYLGCYKQYGITPLPNGPAL